MYITVWKLVLKWRQKKKLSVLFSLVRKLPVLRRFSLNCVCTQTTKSLEIALFLIIASNKRSREIFLFCLYVLLCIMSDWRQPGAEALVNKEECYQSRNNTLFLSSSPPSGLQPDCLGQLPEYWDKGFLLWPKLRKRGRCLTQAGLF